MTITFLGTGSSHGVPVIACSCPTCHSSDTKDKRLRSSVYLSDRGKSILIDAGPDLRQQALRADINRLDTILLTHGHRDHIGGLDEIRSLVFKYKKSVPLYASDNLLKRLRMECGYLFTRALHQKVSSLDPHPIDDTPFVVNGLTTIPIRIYHDNLPIWGFRIGKFTYITDASAIAEEEIAKVRGTTVLVVNALRKESNHAHFSLSEAIAFAKEVKAEATYLTHISHHMGLHEEVSKELPANVHLAYDGLQLSL